MKEPLEHNLKEHFRELRLSEEQLADLNRVQAVGKVGRRTNRRAWLAAPVVLLIAVVGVWWFPSKTPVLNRIADEIAYNHIKNAPNEIHGDSLKAVQDYLNRVDFVLIESRELPSEGWKLLGGRYCSIQGRLAVQLKMRNKQNNVSYTLYQVPFPKKGVNKEQLPSEIFVEGAKVKLWEEKGLLLGLAQTNS